MRRSVKATLRATLVLALWMPGAAVAAGPSTSDDGERRTGAGWDLTVTVVTSSCAAGTCTGPGNAISYGLPVPAAVAHGPLEFFNPAADTGIDPLTVTPTIVVSVPATSYAGTYTSTVTLAAISGP
jgi:hypothetical protein